MDDNGYLSLSVLMRPFGGMLNLVKGHKTIKNQYIHLRTKLIKKLSKKKRRVRAVARKLVEGFWVVRSCIEPNFLKNYQGLRNFQFTQTPKEMEVLN